MKKPFQRHQYHISSLIPVSLQKTWTHTLHLWASLTFLPLSLTSSLGCNRAQHCKDLNKAYQNTLAQQSPDHSTVSSSDPVQIAVELSQKTLASFLETKIVQEKMRFSHREKIAVGSVKISGVLQEIKISMPSDCTQCLRLHGTVHTQVALKGLGLSFSEKAHAKLRAQIPLVLRNKGSRSELLADMQRAKLESLSLRGLKLPSWARKPLDKLLTRAGETLLSQAPNTISLASWKPLKLPGGSVRLYARKIRTFPRQKTVWLGFSTNLPEQPSPGLPSTVRLTPQENAAITFSDSALTGILRAMGKPSKNNKTSRIPMQFNDELKPDKTGDNHITITQVSAADKALETRFIVWHLPKDDACYAAEVKGQTKISVQHLKKQKKNKLNVNMDKLEIVQTRGEDTLFNLALWLRSFFVEEVLAAQTNILTTDTLKLGPLGKRKLDVQRISYHSGSITVSSPFEP